MPVGRIEYLHLGPVRFAEFLGACGEERLDRFLAEWVPGRTVPEALHSRMTDLLREYLVVGGMPAAVAAWVGTRSLHEAEREKQSIVTTYRDDFAKYARRIEVRRVRKVFDALPALVGQRFKYSHVDREERSRDLATALRLLCLARVAHRVRHSAANGVPLAADADEHRVKVLFLDVGLMLSARGLSLVDLVRAREIALVNSGALAEQFVGQHLLHSEAPYKTPDLHFWSRDARNSAAEVDYVIAVGPRVVPVEVKAGRTGTLRSLHAFVDEKGCPFAVRLNSDLPSLVEARTSPPSREGRPFTLLSLPLYMVDHVRRLCGVVGGVADDTAGGAGSG
jgi:predicted AAA+ superfamily ATPase